MAYVSTRNKEEKTTASGAIANGISVEGGLFVPESFKKFTKEDFAQLCNLDYIGRANYVLRGFLDDFSQEELEYCTNGAYKGSFDDENPAPISKLGENINILELWHGPTCAFKDLALQVLPYFMTVSASKCENGKKIVILVATSGDTGKAALEGFKDVEGTEIIVFYPSEGVSPMQKLQMASQSGKNVHVVAIEGNFDDAQTGVKRIFTDEKIKDKLLNNGMKFSSANSINWGRLAPQIVYYVSAYCDMLNNGKDLSNGFNVAVPTGNFGNILAAYYAKKMGVPINKLICASNKNNVLTDFIATGTYDRNRKFFTTTSPSMDILISSNLERLLFEFYDGDDKAVANLQELLAKTGKYTVSNEVKAKIDENFFGGCCDDEQTLETIGKVFKEYGYLCDTHTAVAVNVYNQYLEKTGDNRPVVIASTASAYKFANNVLSAVSDKRAEDEFDYVRKLNEETKQQIPMPIAKLENAVVRFNEVCKKEEMENAVFEALNIK